MSRTAENIEAAVFESFVKILVLIKTLTKVEEKSEEESSGHASGGSVTITENQGVNHEHQELCKPIEPGKEKFIFNGRVELLIKI